VESLEESERKRIEEDMLDDSKADYYEELGEEEVLRAALGNFDFVLNEVCPQLDKLSKGLSGSGEQAVRDAIVMLGAYRALLINIYKGELRYVRYIEEV